MYSIENKQISGYIYILRQQRVEIEKYFIEAENNR